MKSRDNKETSGGSDASNEFEGDESFSKISKNGPKVATEDKSNDKKVEKVSGNKTIFERSYPTDESAEEGDAEYDKLKKGNPEESTVQNENGKGEFYSKSVPCERDNSLQVNENENFSSAIIESVSKTGPKTKEKSVDVNENLSIHQTGSPGAN